ncbi:MAG: tetraacyldisaccharide 4'-kinase [Methylococcales bacterium]|nr:tetraacyldisaccharide 4'-kinase [Methylococcales bacterium]
MKKNFSRWLQDAWYTEMYVSSAIMPLSMLYDDAMRFRRFLYKTGVLKKTRLTVPVIIVGNITVGGTGKTPLVLWMARFLREEGFKPGIISRGYGGNAETWPQWVDGDSRAEVVGDEAVLMAMRSDCAVVVGPERVTSARLLLDKSDCDVILSDDGLQHYAIERDIEIAVIDGERRFGNGYTLPCGPLREPITRLETVDLVIVNGVAEEENEFSMTIEGDIAVNLVTKEEKLLSDFALIPSHAVAGIGNPKRFFNLLERKSIAIDCHSFPDHHQFIAEDILFEDDKPILMTEKDAVKCMDFASDKHWYVPIKAVPQQQFVDKLLTLIKEKTRG